MRALAEEQSRGILEPGRAETVRAEVVIRDGVQVAVDVPKEFVTPEAPDLVDSPVFGTPGAGVGPKGQAALRAAMERLLEQSEDVSQLEELTGMSANQLRELEFLSGDDASQMSREERHQRQQMVASLLAQMESDAGVSTAEELLDALHLGSTG